MNLDDFAAQLLKEHIKLKADFIVLELLVKVIIEKYQPEVSEKIIAKYEEMKKQSFDEILLNHPLLKETWDNLLSELEQ